MKLTIDEALRTVSTQAMKEAPPTPSYRSVWLRAEYRRRQQQQARLRLFQAVVPAAAATLGSAGLVWWKGAWLRGDALRQLSTLAASGLDALGGNVPLAAILGLVTITFVLTEEMLSSER